MTEKMIMLLQTLQKNLLISADSKITTALFGFNIRIVL